MGDGDCATPSPGGGPGGESFVSFCFCSAAGPAASGTQNINKEQFPQSLGLKRRRVVNRASRVHFPLPLSPGSRWLPKSTPPAHSWNQVRVVALQSPLQVVTRRAVTSLKPGSCVSFHTRRNQVSVTLHTQTPPLPSQARPSQAPGRVPVLHHAAPPRVRRLAPLVPLARSSRSLVSAPRSVSVAPADHQTRLRDSVRPASPQVQGCPLHFSESCRCPCPVCGNRSPAGEGCDRTGPSSRYEVGVLQPLLHCAQEKRWVTTDLGSASFERALHKLPFRMLTQKRIFGLRPSPRLVCSDRPEGCVLSCLDPPATQAIPAIRVRGVGHISTRSCPSGCPCRLVSSPKSRRRPLFPWENEGCASSTTSTTGSYLHSLASSCAHTRTWCSGTSASWAFGSTGKKSKTRANTEDLFSRHGVGFGQPDSTPHPGTCSVGAELPQDFIRQDGGPTETLSEAPGAYGCSCGDSAARSAPYETASALAPWPNPEVGVGTRYSPGSDYTGLPQNLQPVVRSLVPSGRSGPWSRYPACGGIHGCLGHWLGSHVQRARSVRGLDGSPTALAYQLPRAAGSTPGLEPPQRAPSGQGRSGPYGQHCDRCVYQPARRFTLPSHVATRPPPPPLESEASEVPSCHPHPRSAQPGSRRAVSSSTSRGVETPSSGGPADLESVRSCSGRPVCISGNHPLPVVLLPNRGKTLGKDALAHSWPQGLRKYAFPPVSLLAQTLCKIREDEEQVLLVAPYWHSRTLVPELMLLATAPPWPIPLRKDLLSQRRAHPPATRVQTCGTPCVVPGRDAEVLGDLPQEVASHYCFSTSTVHRRAYALKWNLFVEWCFLSPWGPPEMFDQSRAVPSCSKGWSVGCPPPPLKFTLLLFQPPRPRRREIGGETRSGHQVS